MDLRAVMELLRQDLSNRFALGTHHTYTFECPDNGSARAEPRLKAVKRSLTILIKPWALKIVNMNSKDKDQQTSA